MFLLAKYNTQTTFTFPVVKRAVVDLAATADWTPATGDTKISKDAGNVANTTNNPAAVGGTGSVMWSLTLTAAELSAAVVDVQIVDSATKAIEDQAIKIYTYGNASAKIPLDISNLVNLGLSVLPVQNPGADNGLPVCDSTGSVLIRSNQIVVKKNTAFNNFEFVMIDSADHVTGKTGLTVTATRSIDGGAFGACANSASEVSSGVYKINLAAGDLNGNCITLRFTGSGADDTLITILTQA